MTVAQPDVRRCTVYGDRGDARFSLEIGEASSSPHERVVVADRVAIGEVMSGELICARPALDVRSVVRLMVQHRVGCLPVVDERRHPIGVITKFDIVEHLDAAMQSAGKGAPLPIDLSPRQAEEVMMPIALVLDEHATVAHAAAMMALEDTHHVLVVRGAGELIGVVSSKDIVKWLARGD